MQQRKSASGRPSGTDGSDFSYRMVIDPRYTKVAQGKSRLRILITIQVVSQVIGVLWGFLLASQGKDLDTLAISLIVIGCISIIAGELGRRRSHANLLRLYIAASTITAMVSAVRVVGSGLSFEVLQDQNASVLKKFEVVEAGRVLLSVPVQIFAVITTVLLIQNMSPRRAS
ncbi:uncharacterized protein LOC131248352 [Magnolia sinica]|uniref:uncharacterized protein LOC131248352 n=1 Tax=Magnolia sinica TaxID=86752 RepID=UPI0026580951|nr:uncharacterized protein LOC131248352 [Magnolia sinica]XP_058104594.1 uncharacterized protein LOC131248352 [Magnolia sinica]XP_058104595.1 uncharacterized protein LOC131248352 [Magnolia sinica]XP_058104596.1 uncharacterized protein LOC131248352 [Magnolia sinica]XP_058104597.1 uncharacterized protein LOC131248352 [Magnolia sinica]